MRRGTRRHERGEREARGLVVERGQLGSSKPASDDQRRKGRGKDEFRKHAGSSESERKLRGGEYIHDHRHSILNTRRSVLYTWQPEDIVAESNRAYRPGHRGIQIETKAQKVEGGQVARPAGGQERRGARLADGRTFGNTEPGTKTQHTERGVQHDAGRKPGTQVSIVHDTDRTRRNEANEQARKGGKTATRTTGDRGSVREPRTIHLTRS